MREGGCVHIYAKIPRDVRVCLKQSPSGYGERDLSRTEGAARQSDLLGVEVYEENSTMHPPIMEESTETWTSMPARYQI